MKNRDCVIQALKAVSEAQQQAGHDIVKSPVFGEFGELSVHNYWKFTLLLDGGLLLSKIP